MTINIYRQGDVLLVEAAGTYAPPAPVGRQGRAVLAEGETTGHAHVLAGETATYWPLEDLPEVDASDLLAEIEAVLGRDPHRQVTGYVATAAGATVTHDEHAPIELPPGAYYVLRPRTYTSADMAPIRSLD